MFSLHSVTSVTAGSTCSSVAESRHQIFTSADISLTDRYLHHLSFHYCYVHLLFSCKPRGPPNTPFEALFIDLFDTWGAAGKQR